VKLSKNVFNPDQSCTGELECSLSLKKEKTILSLTIYPAELKSSSHGRDVAGTRINLLYNAFF